MTLLNYSKMLYLNLFEILRKVRSKPFALSIIYLVIYESWYEKNKNILIRFLNDILGLTGEAKIEDVTFLSPVQDPKVTARKESIVDVLCRDSTGTQLICEMKVARMAGFEKRARYYAAKAYSGQDDRYRDLKEIIFIAITDFILFPGKPEYKSDRVTLDGDNCEHNLKDFSFTFIELPKFSKNKVEQLTNTVERWCFFLKHSEETAEEDLENIVREAPIIKQAYDELDKYRWEEKDLIIYEERIMDLRKEEAILEQKFDEGREEGRKARKIEVAKTYSKPVYLST
jgi:predicted transposase/invertase (TIGR01784 family)